MDKVFWPLLGIALVLLVISTSNFILISVSILFVLTALTWMKLSDTHWEMKEFKNKLTDYLERLETAVIDKLNEIENSPDTINLDNPNPVGNPESSSDFAERDLVEDKFDKMAKKLIDTENKLTKTKRTLATAFAALDDRLRSIEEELTILRPEKERN